MNYIEVRNISKAFDATRAVDDLSFEVKQGEIFGLLGPNGAGKTTTIRLLLDIFKPDNGSISILGGTMDESKKERIGYLPEERGLYQEARLERCLVYLATLKGLSVHEARQRIAAYIERFDLTAHKKKKIKELSKGMQQKAQIIATIVHQPDIIIIDEPFASLDPVNTQMVKDMIRELRQQGIAILMSTHQMHQVEELCQRILLINEGRNILYGDLGAIKKQFTGDEVLIRLEGELPLLSCVQQVVQRNNDLKLTMLPGKHPNDLLRELLDARVDIERFELAVPSLDEIFIRTVKRG